MMKQKFTYYVHGSEDMKALKSNFPRRAASGGFVPVKGELMKSDGVFDIYKRVKVGKTYYDFVENATPAKNPDYPMVYTYSDGVGNLTYGTGARWARQEILTNSPAAQKAGKRPALPHDLEGALEVAKKHYEQYQPSTPHRYATKPQKA